MRAAARHLPMREENAWPYTRRPLPWLFAALLVMIFLVPFDAMQLKVAMPVSSDFDRFLVMAIVGVWAIGTALGKPQAVERLRPPGWAIGMIAFLLVAVASIAFNVERITNLGEWDDAQKHLAVLFSLAAVFAIVTLNLRASELRPFSVLIVVLAVITATGTIYEKKSGFNVFYETSAAVFSPIADVAPSPTDVNPDPSTTPRPTITGPTRHALSVTSILGMALPFAVVLAAMTPVRRRRILWGLAACIIIAGALITQRKSGAVVPAMALLVLFVLRPRQLLRLAPFGVVALAVALVVTPGIFSTVRELGQTKEQDSTEGRTSDYPAVVPDVLTRPMIGRGFGTLDSERVDTYRIFDNEYLGQLFQVGALGLLAFIALIVTPLFVARSVLRSDDPVRGPPALAAGAACLAFGVACSLYDILTFPQAPYLFLFMAAICTCAASVEVPAGWTARVPTVMRRTVTT
ncbi:MAG TPA: O-antigen ligase family protein [Solirubrobacterales bacterium]|nr:O-antigen ligase family protein [Solirubrobacterales bacterium]